MSLNIIPLCGRVRATDWDVSPKGLPRISHDHFDYKIYRMAPFIKNDYCKQQCFFRLQSKAHPSGQLICPQVQRYKPLDVDLILRALIF